MRTQRVRGREPPWDQMAGSGDRRDGQGCCVRPERRLSGHPGVSTTVPSCCLQPCGQGLEGCGRPLVVQDENSLTQKTRHNRPGRREAGGRGQGGGERAVGKSLGQLPLWLLSTERGWGQK